MDWCVREKLAKSWRASEHGERTIRTRKVTFIFGMRDGADESERETFGKLYALCADDGGARVFSADGCERGEARRGALGTVGNLLSAVCVGVEDGERASKFHCR